MLSVLPNVAELNSKIPHLYNGEIVLYYYSTTWLYAREFVGKEFEGCYPQVTCLYRDGQPNQQTIMTIGKGSRFRWISCNMGVWRWIRIRAYVRGVSKYL